MWFLEALIKFLTLDDHQKKKKKKSLQPTWNISGYIKVHFPMFAMLHSGIGTLLNQGLYPTRGSANGLSTFNDP